MGRKRGLTFNERLVKLMEQEPDLTQAEAVRRVKLQYHAKTPEGKAKQKAGLRRGNPKTSRTSAVANRVQRPGRGLDIQAMNIIEFAEKALCLKLHPSQRALLKALYGIRPGPGERQLLGKLMGGMPPKDIFKVEKTEAVWALGARSGKSFKASIIALYEATRGRWRAFLRKGEVGYVVIVATRLEQARAIIQRNAAEMMLSSKIADLLDGEPLATEIPLKNGMKILSIPCNSTAGRGLPICTLILDEVAHFQVDGAKADSDIFASLRPRLAQFASAYAKTVMISTPAAKQGLFWDMFKDGFHVADRVTAQAPTLLMNPTIPPSFVDSERGRDPDNCAREFDARFAERRAAFLPTDRIEAALVIHGDQPPHGHQYACGIDQSGLSGRDRFALAVAHKNLEGMIEVDCLRSWQTSDADEVLAGVDEVAKLYGFKNVFIDRYAGGWVQTALEKLGALGEHPRTLAIGLREPKKPAHCRAASAPCKP